MRYETGTSDARRDERVLVLLPESQDAGAVPRVLEKVGMVSLACATPEEALAEMERGAGLLLVAEEMLTHHNIQKLIDCLQRQPAWSELPIIVLLRHGQETDAARDALLLPADVTLIERPVRVNTLVAVVASALRSRRRQYLVRDQMRALDLSEARYRALFESMDQGYCIVELVPAAADRPMDFRFVEVNPSFSKNTGLTVARGSSLREITPPLEEQWFVLFGLVAMTGQAVRFEKWEEGLQRWFDVYSFPFGELGNGQAAILFSDITARKAAEAEVHAAKDELEVRVLARTAELTSALQKLQEETEERLRKIEEIRLKDQLLMRQGRFAAMGEMIGFIAHQWRQPLNTLALMVQEPGMLYEMGGVDNEYLARFTEGAMRVIGQMSQTISDFRNFFSPDKQKVTFRIAETLASTIKLVEATFRDSQLAIDISAVDDVATEGYPNEYAQVLLNILLNAKDVFQERNVLQPRIRIRIFMEAPHAVMTIADNAGGIMTDSLETIFDPYFTTKGPEKGTGIGLYMAKTIIERNMGGRLSVRNTEDGAEFRIETEARSADSSDPR